MVDNNPQGSVNLTGSVHSVTADGNGTKWEPYWDETYKRYYWSDGNESVGSSSSTKFHCIFEIYLGLGNASRLC